MLVQQTTASSGVGEGVFPYVTGGGGLELMVTPRVSLALANDYVLVEGLDGIEFGRIHDSFWSLTSALTFYPF